MDKAVIDLLAVRLAGRWRRPIRWVFAAPLPLTPSRMLVLRLTGLCVRLDVAVYILWTTSKLALWKTYTLSLVNDAKPVPWFTACHTACNGPPAALRAQNQA